LRADITGVSGSAIATRAARWVAEKGNGRYSMQDVLDLNA
jgi:dihydrodipicolinate reductase